MHISGNSVVALKRAGVNTSEDDPVSVCGLVFLFDEDARLRQRMDAKQKARDGPPRREKGKQNPKRTDRQGIRFSPPP